MKLYDPVRNDTRNKRNRLLPLALAAFILLLPLTAAAAPKDSSVDAPAKLPLGDGSLPESRTDTTLAPGLTLTTIARGQASENDYYTLRIPVPTSEKSFSLLAPREQAQQVVTRLQGAGFRAELHEERNPDYLDLRAGTLGYNVQVGRYANREATRDDMKKLSGLGFRPMPQFTGEDGEATGGPWMIRVLTLDPRLFQGEIHATHGSYITGRATVSKLAQQTGAIAAVNAGFFVMSPAAGTPGDPAGLFVDHGKVLSEATNGRVTMNIFNRNKAKGKTSVRFLDLTTTVNLIIGKKAVRRIDGINRNPGMVRNCGGIGDTPTDLPRHDFTCTDPDEMVVITPEFGTAAPKVDGMEAAVDQTGKVIEIRKCTGGAIPAGGMLVQGIGADATWLTSHLAVGTRVRLDIKVTDGKGKRLKYDANDSAVNGGPHLVSGGRSAIQPVADGLIHPENPSFFLSWGIRRHPRTMAGIDRQGRILLVTVDGKRPDYSVGLSLMEGSQLMIGLGAVEAINLDGGGSTAMVINGKLVGSPSDPTGERAVSDAIVIKAK